MPPSDSLFARLTRGAKALSAAPHPAYRDTLGWSGYTSGIGDRFLAGRLPDDFFTNRERVGDGGFTGIVENTLAVKTRGFTEIHPQVGVLNPDDPTAPPEPDPDHPLNMLLDEPNEAMTWRQLGEYIVASQDVNGTGYLVKVGTNAGEVVSLWPLYPEAVEPVSRNREFITYWRYELEGVETRIDPADMVVFRNRLNRADHRIGQSSLEPILREVATDEEAARFASTILHNLGVPGVVLTARDQYNPPSREQADATLATWADRFSGASRGKPWIQSDYDISVVSFSPQQMDLRTLRQIPEERVTGALGVPAILAGMGAGLQQATYSNAAELRAFFTEQTLIPLWEHIADTLTRSLLSLEDRMAGRVVYFDHTKVRSLQEDRNAEAERIVRLVGGNVLTIDEGRELLGYGPLPDVVDVDEGVGTAFIEGDPDSVSLTDDEPVAVDTDSDERRLPPILRKSGFDDDYWEDRYDDAVGDVLAGWAATFARLTDDAIDGVDVDVLLVAADEAVDGEQLRTVLLGLGVALIDQSGRSDDAIPTKVPTLNPDDVARGLTRFMDQHAARRADGMTEWTRVRVRNIISKGVDEGRPLSEIRSDIDRWLKDPNRAKTIARTEVTAARNASTNFAAQNDPRPMWKTWRVFHDGRARDSHAQADGQRVLDFESFNVGGWAMSYPGDPAGPASETINCRCRLEYRLATRTPGGYYGR